MPDCLSSFLLLALLLPAPGSAEDPSLPSQSGQQDADEAVALVRAGEYEKARELLGQILIRREFLSAEERLASGDPRDALVCYDRILQLEPKNARALYLRGQASYAAAGKFPADAFFFYEDALANFERAWQRGFGVAALFEASRAARMANQSEKALNLALQAMGEFDKLDPRPTLEQAGERTLIEASFGCYVDRLQKGEDGAELLRITEDALLKLLGQNARDPWPWQQLSNLYQWSGELERALSQAQLGLEQVPEDVALHGRVSELLRSTAGRDGVIAHYTGFVERYPKIALGWWYRGLELVLRGGDQVQQQLDGTADFEAAEKDFQACRVLAPQFEGDCKGYEVICRSGLGWSAIYRKDLAAAERYFHSMEDVLEKGLTWAYPPYLYSGVQGLQRLADDYYIGHEEEAAAVANAVAIYDFLQAYVPEDGTIANNAGFFNRDFAVLLDQQAELALARAQSAEPNERDVAQTEARELRQRALERMQRSWEAYVRAAELSPEDARIQNDTGLIMIYYLRSDAQLAEQYCLKAVELGQAQLQDEAYLSKLPVSVREDLPVALGDAYQNLGVLYLTMLRQTERALEYFQKSVAVGPHERIDIKEQWIPACELMQAGDPAALDALRSEIWLHQGR